MCLLKLHNSIELITGFTQSCQVKHSSVTICLYAQQNFMNTRSSMISLNCSLQYLSIGLALGYKFHMVVKHYVPHMTLRQGYENTSA